MGGEPTPVITLYNCPRHHHYVFMASPVNACVAHVGDLRWSALLEQPWSVFLQLRPAQVGQDSWWMEHVGRQSGRTAAQRGPGPLLKKLLHSGVLLSGPAGGGCDLLQLLRYSAECFGDSVLELDTLWNGGMLLGWYTVWGLEVCTVNFRGLFMGWIDFALQYFLDIIGCCWLFLMFGKGLLG